MPKRLPLIFLLFCFFSYAGAQSVNKSGILKGKLINSVTHEPFHDVRVTMPDLNTFTSSDGEGVFTVSEVPYGKQTVVVGGGNAMRDTFTVTISQEITDMGDIQVKPNDRSNTADGSDIPTVAFEEENTVTDDEGASTSGTSSVYGFNQDPFLYNASIIFGAYHFRPRGVNNGEIQINGISVQDLETGFTSIGQVGGLNDVLRDRVVTYGLKPSEFTFGGVTGSTYINATAADQRKGTNISYYSANRQFRNRVMATVNSGVNKDGWAYSFSASRRWAKEGYIPGTFYDGFSAYAAVSKVTKKGQLNLTAMAAPTKRGKAYTATDEVFALAGDHHYNSSWGYQNGEKRNPNVSDVFQPTIIANYTYKPDEKTRWNTAFGYEFGKSKNSSIDDYNAYSAVPTYYRNLPSYYLNFNPPNTEAATAVQNQLQSHPGQLQIDWNELYQANYTNFENNGGVYGRRSLYVISNKVDNMNKFSFNTNIEHVKNDHLTLFGGLSFVAQGDEYYKQLADLLGGDYFVNYNQFAQQQSVGNPNYVYNDLKNPTAVVRVGDKYGYDYKEMVRNGNAWGQGAFTYNKVDFFLAANLGYTGFSRDGLMQNGIFPNNSYGTSATHNFLTYKVKGGATYKLDARNFFFFDAFVSTDAPTVANTYISVATRDFTVPNPKVSNTTSMEFGYSFKSPKFNVRAVMYATNTTNASLIKRFFNDDPSILTFVNYAMTNVSTRSVGTELSANYKLDKTWSLTGLASIGQNFYSDNPTIAIYQDNDPTLTATSHNVYIKNYYLASGPQSIYSLGVNYRPRNYWNANLSFNYMDRSYVDINPDRRTQAALDLVPKGSAQWNSIINQEKLPGAFTVDLHVGKSFDVSRYVKHLNHRTLLNFQVGIQNLLDNNNIKSLGYEQLRFDYTYHNPNKFANTYEYAMGINYYATLSLRF